MLLLVALVCFVAFVLVVSAARMAAGGEEDTDA